MKAKAIHLKQSITVPGTRILGTVSILPEKHPTAKLTVGDLGVTVEENGISAFIPMSNVQVIILETEGKSGRSE